VPPDDFERIGWLARWWGAGPSVDLVTLRSSFDVIKSMRDETLRSMRDETLRAGLRKRVIRSLGSPQARALLLGLRQHRFQQGLAELLRHRAVHGVPHSAQTATLVVELVEQAQDDLQGIVL